MDPISLFLLIVAGILVMGTLGEVIFVRTKVPDVLWLVLIGVLLGPVFHLVSRDFVWGLAPFFSALALVVIMFEGGLGLKLGELLSGAPRGFALAVLGVLFSVAAVVAVSEGLAFLGFLPGWSLPNSVLLGSIVGGTSSIIIMPLGKTAKLREEVANLLSIESAVNDTLCVVLVIAVIQFILEPGSGLDTVVKNIAAQFSVGGFLGIVAGLLWLWLLRFLQGTAYSYTLTFAVMMFLYVISNAVNGSAAITVLLFGVVLGNGAAISSALRFPEVIAFKQDARGFHEQLSFFIKTFFFVFIGLLMSLETGTFLIGLAVSAAVLLVRPLAVWLSAAGGKFSSQEKKLMTIAMPRGFAAAVLAVMPSTYGIPGSEQYTGIAFSVILITILVFTIGFRFFCAPGSGNGSAGKGPPGKKVLEESKPMERPPREAVHLEAGPEPREVEGIREQDY